MISFKDRLDPGGWAGSIRVIVAWGAVTWGMVLVPSHASVSLQPEGAEGQVILKAAQIHTLAAQGSIEPGFVKIEGGRIVAVGDADAVGLKQGTTDDAGVIDLGGAHLIPGLVDAAALFESLGPDAEVTSEVTPTWTAADSVNRRARALREAFDQGITTLAVLPGSDNVVGGWAAVFKTTGDQTPASLVEPRAGLTVTLASDPARRNRSGTRPDSIYVRLPTNRMGVVWLLRRAFQQAEEEPDNPEFQPIRQALKGNTRLMVRARTAFDLEAALRVLEEFHAQAPPILVGGQEAYNVIDQIKRAGASVALERLRTNAVYGPEATELVWNLPGILAKAGIPFALTGGDLLEQARFAHRFGLGEVEALAAITRVPAGLLGLSERLGAIAPGYDADLVVLDGPPLQWSTNVRGVILNGRLPQSLHRNTRKD
ncbi:amidohydrolase [Isosphaera pallida ATCC 43644]|uniref:Amidohydrolase n=1 Tax=Isosphaera pallida (strain ATCC 43644 / DSM 9630 / IS1B) TaxID=575540 RepID=E8R6E6_ISOPI|nr:amidohydrolase family protein [Isosphaera pallida]ADV61847.1 amidohydrolase [Isosphaera pallida ATCC 43644]